MGWRGALVALLLLVLAAVEFSGLVLVVPLLVVLDPALARSLPAAPVDVVFAVLERIGLGVGVWSVVLLVISLAALRAVLSWFCHVLLARLQRSFVESVRLQLYRSLVSARWSAVAAVDPSSVRFSVARAVDALALVLDSVVRLVVAGLHAAAQLAVAVVVVPSAALVALVFVVVLPVFMALAVRVRTLGADYLAAQQRLSAVVDGYLSRLKPACVHRTGSAEHASLVRVVDDLLGVHGRVAAFSGLSSALVPLVSVSTVVVLLAVSHSVFAVPVVRLGVLAVIALRIVPSLQVVADSLPRLANLMPTCAHLRDLRSRLAAAVRRDAFVPPSALPCPPEVDVRAAGFLYSGGAVVPPDGWDARVRAGSLVLLCGPSGTGKTTCLDLLAGLLDPTSGSVAVDGVAPWRYPGAIGYLPQSVSPVPASLREHLAWAGARVDPSAARRLLERLDLRLAGGPGWLDARVGPGARELSGGEWSRLHLAAVLLARPRLLLLDEPTADLDSVSAARVVAVVRACRPEATVVVASHDSCWRDCADAVIDLGVPASGLPAAGTASLS